MPGEKIFIQTIKEHEGIIFKVSNLYADSKEDRQDLVQEIIYQLWRSFDSFQSNSKLSTWIYRVALNTAIGHLRKSSRQKKGDQEEQEIIHQMHFDNSEQEKLIDTLYKAIKRLNDVDKSIILLSLDGKNHQEISEISGFTKTNVGTRISRIKIKLKSLIKTD